LAQDDGRRPDAGSSVADFVSDAPRPSDEVEALGGESNPELLPKRQPWGAILHGIGVVEQVIGAGLLVVILVLVLAQVAQRYVPGSWPWTGEVARLSMVWATFVMAGYLAAHDRHIAIHVADYVLRGRALAALKLFVDLAVLVTCLFLLHATYQLVAGDIGQVTAAAEIPLRYVNAVPILGFALVALRALLGITLRDIPALLGHAEAS
jgi:TRAP-type C4-dicarboxylate transport system permease small subunit